MKILKIRENKLKLTLSAQEATEYGLDSKKCASNKELRDILLRIFDERRELFSPQEKLLIEAYARLDGSCDIFVTNLAIGEERGALVPTECGRSYWAFETAEHLALALYVLMVQKERAEAISLCDRDQTVLVEEEGQNILDPSEGEISVVDDYQSIHFGTCDLVQMLNSKSISEKKQNLAQRLPSCRIFRTEGRRAHEHACAYILEIKSEGAEKTQGERISVLCEFAAPVAPPGQDVLSEHTREITPDEILRA